ncbi:MAG TPA: GyrI-like domain-containing protein [Anaerolineae bacterium]|nr:GyrI-like domain-containing protein [Anaerolineae bacterium]
MGKIKTGAYNPLPVAPIVLVGANVNGKPNYMAAGFVNGVNVKPAILYVSLNKRHYTPKGIIENGTFSLNIPCADYVIETDYCGLVSGRSADKSGIFTTFYGELETAPMIAEFPITCECRYTGQKVEFEMDTVYFGEVIQVHVNSDLLNEEQKIDILKANPIYYSGIENRYRTLGADMGPAWRIGREYTPKQASATQESVESRYRCAIVERPAQPALTIRSRAPLMALARTIGESMAAIAQYAGRQGYIPAGPPFVAYHGFDGREQDVEIGFPFNSGVEGKTSIQVSAIPGGKSAAYHYIGPYDRLPEIRVGLQQWLNTNGYTPVGVIYENYLSDPQRTAPENLETEILVPLLVTDGVAPN